MNSENCYLYAQLLSEHASKHIYIYKIAINLYSITHDVYKNIATVDINVNCMSIHICLTRSVKNPYQGQINMNCENCYICIHSYKVNPYLRIFTFINVASYQCVMNMYYVFSFSTEQPTDRPLM